jgi:hypothetical protein
MLLHHRPANVNRGHQRVGWVVEVSRSWLACTLALQGKSAAWCRIPAWVKTGIVLCSPWLRPGLPHAGLNPDSRDERPDEPHGPHRPSEDSPAPQHPGDTFILVHRAVIGWANQKAPLYISTARFQLVPGIFPALRRVLPQFGSISHTTNSGRPPRV